MFSLLNNLINSKTLFNANIMKFVFQLSGHVLGSSNSAVVYLPSINKMYQYNHA